MATSPQQAAHPVRTLTILGLIVLALGVWTFWPGQDPTPKLGLDLRGGTQVILTPVSENGQTVTEEQLSQSVSIIRQRVDGFGVAEAEVTTQGSGSNASIIVSIPGTTNDAILDSLSTTAKLDFRPVLAAAPGTPTSVETPTPSPSGSVAPDGTASPTASPSASPSPSPTSSDNPAGLSAGVAAQQTATPSPTPSPTASGGLTTRDGYPPIQSPANDQALQQAFLDLDCTPAEATQGGPADPTLYIATCSTDGGAKYLLDPAAVQGTEIASAQAGLSQTGGGWEVQLTFTSDGAQQFADVTGKLAQNQPPQDQFAITLDGLVVSAPSVNKAIIGGSAVITGQFTADEAKSLANVLKYGSLPVTLTVSSVEQLSPTLGQDQLDAGIIAGALGLLLVVIYLLAYYRGLGLVAVASLVIAAFLTYFVLVILGRQLGLALTLAGVAGAIVAIGITADSFVVYFERIRDEIREGRSLRAAGDAGWIRARRTLLAADFVSLLAAVVLYFLSVGSVRGFAFMLGLTTIIDVLVAFMFSRPLVSLLMRSPKFSSGKPWTGLSPDRLGVKQPIPVVATTRTSVSAGSAQKES